MKTKNYFQVMATIAASLMLISLLTFSGRTARADTPSVIYEPVMVYELRSTGAEIRRIYSYGTCGNTLEYQGQSKVGTEWVTGYTITYIWDEYGNNLSALSYGLVSESGEKGSWTYDCNGNILTYLDEMVYGGDLYPYYRDSYTYDGYGNCIFSLEEYWEEYNTPQNSGHWLS